MKDSIKLTISGNIVGIKFQLYGQKVGDSVPEFFWLILGIIYQFSKNITDKRIQYS